MDLTLLKDIHVCKQPIQEFLTFLPSLNIVSDYTCEPIEAEKQSSPLNDEVRKKDDGTYTYIWHSQTFSWNAKKLCHNVTVTFSNLSKIQATILWVWLHATSGDNRMSTSLMWCWEHTHQNDVSDTPYSHRLLIANIVAKKDVKGRLVEWLGVNPEHLKFSSHNPYLSYFLPHADAHDVAKLYPLIQDGIANGVRYHIGANQSESVEDVFNWVIDVKQNKISHLVTVNILQPLLNAILKPDEIYYVGPSWVDSCREWYPHAIFLSSKKTVEELLKTLPKYPLRWWNERSAAFYAEYADNISITNEGHRYLLKNLSPECRRWFCEKLIKRQFKGGKNLVKLHECLQWSNLNDLEYTRHLLSESYPQLDINTYINSYKEAFILGTNRPSALTTHNSIKEVSSTPEEEVFLFL